jgi:hypothetical protein
MQASATPAAAFLRYDFVIVSVGTADMDEDDDDDFGCFALMLREDGELRLIDYGLALARAQKRTPTRFSLRQTTSTVPRMREESCCS